MLRRLSLVTALTFALGAVGAAQDPAPQPEPQSISVQGCLQQAGDPPTYTLTAADGRSFRVEAGESVSLAEYANKTVEAAGTVTTTEAGEVLTATSVKAVSDTCTP